MKKLQIAVGSVAKSQYASLLSEMQSVSERHWCDLENANLCDISAVVVDITELYSKQMEQVIESGYSLPLFVFAHRDDVIATQWYAHITGVLDPKKQSMSYYRHQIAESAKKYEAQVLPPFFGMLENYVEMGNAQFDCPGHQGGQFYRKHPAGKQFFEFFGENLFRSDLCNADVALGDLLIHEGAAEQAQRHAAKVYNADKTYFVLNGTSSANKVVCNALCTPGDLVLFDRNNHKSNHHGALLQAGATPVYLETARNPFGLIGGIDEHCFDEAYIRAQIAKVDPERATQARPFRLAIIQLGTYDGTIYNARYVMDKLGHLCDYILFDSAWVGYEQFIPMMKDCSPLLLELTEQDAGVIVTQSVHKQQAGFSQTSQIHKKDAHLHGQDRYCNHKRFNNAFMMHASTSPFYALFSALDVNAKMHEGEAGRKMWADCVALGIEARKEILNTCQYIRPFIPATVDGKPWQGFPTETIANDKAFFAFDPKADWHKFEGYGDHQYFVDPCKLLLTTAGIDPETGEYSDFGIPATLLANFLRENGVVPEKCDLNSILFLLTPAEDMAKLRQLVALLNRFEQFVMADAPLSSVLPNLYQAHQSRYEGYRLRQLCQEIHDMYRAQNVKALQKAMFRQAHFPEMKMLPQAANVAYFRGECDYIPIAEAEGRIAAEGALPYPPGILCVVNGEVWTKTVRDYFLALEEGINRFPGFAPELQGVYLESIEGRVVAYCYVLK